MTRQPTPEEWAQMSWHARDRHLRRVRMEQPVEYVPVAPAAPRREKARIRRRSDGWWELTYKSGHALAMKAEILWCLLADSERGAA